MLCQAGLVAAKPSGGCQMCSPRFSAKGNASFIGGTPLCVIRGREPRQTRMERHKYIACRHLSEISFAAVSPLYSNLFSREYVSQLRNIEPWSRKCSTELEGFAGHDEWAVLPDIEQ
jgi:hypothetical protein